MAFLDTVSGFVRNVTAGAGSSSVFGVDISSATIKVVQLRKDKGSAVLETYGELALGPYAELDIGRATNLSPEKLGEALKDIMREANVTTKNCGASIPFAASLVQLIDMPKAAQGQLSHMLPIEARKYIPVPISEVQLDWFVVPEEEQRMLEGDVDEEAAKEEKRKERSDHISVLLVAIHNEILRRYNDSFVVAGISPSFYEIEVFSAMRSVLGQHLNPVAILDLGAATSKLYIIEMGIIYASHVIGKGSQDITLALSHSMNTTIEKAEERKRIVGLAGNELEDNDSRQIAHSIALTMEYILEEARLTLMHFQQKHNKAVEKTILIGGGAAMSGVGAFAGERLGTPVEIGDPFGSLQSPAFLEGLLKEVGPGFAVATGLALRKLHDSG